MMANRFTSVVSLLDLSPVIRSPSPSPSPSSLVPVSSQRLSFSINRILGLEDDVELRPSSSSSVCTESPRCFMRSPSPSSNITSSNSEYDSESYQVPSPSEQLPRKKRQRTTFSQIEVWELELAFRRRPYLTSEDEEELVQRLGITVKSLRYWFQNRRAKSKREEKLKASVCQTSPSNQFRRHQERPCPSFQAQSTADQLLRLKVQRVCYPAVTHLENQPCSRPVKTGNYCPSIKLNQIRGEHSFPLPMFHQDQIKIRSAEPARRPYSRVSHIFQPY